MKRWNMFRRWISHRWRKNPASKSNQACSSESQLSNSSHQAAAVDKLHPNKIYIPYDSAEVCVSQITDDMEAMKRRHLEMIQELEANFRITVGEKQKKTVQKIRSHYQKRLNLVKTILDMYQEKVEKRNAVLEKRVAALTALNEQLQEEQRAERSRSKEVAVQWQREKSKILESFSSRLDLLHIHQASTLQELQLARQEIGKVQEMLTALPQQPQEETREHEVENPQTGGEQQTGNCSAPELPLEGAKARLEELKESLYQREREITELLGSERHPVPLFPQPSCSVLLNTVVQKAHVVCRTVDQSRLVLDQMIEENCAALVEARDKLQRLQMEIEEGKDKTTDVSVDGEFALSSLQDKVRECELCWTALHSIKSGKSPFINNDCDMGSELDDVLGTTSAGSSEDTKSVGQQLIFMQDQLKQLKEENKKVIENYTSERTMRKKLYNMVEEMKGKIRVFCRIRPASRSESAQSEAVVVERIDEFSVKVETSRGGREFQFDKVFSCEASQTELFLDVSRLIQSAIDGYNVCIFAYGQTGSGKTFTMVGDKDQKNPGIMPRTFNAIFDIITENRNKFEYRVSTYMLELYNDRLQDLLVTPSAGAGSSTAESQQSHGAAHRVEIKRNRKGVVFAQGAEKKEASSARELYALFKQACANRHISATKMNVESSRSHLIVGITVESRNLTNGSVSSGKVSLVDLAGSERAAKTGAKDHQLKEANSINKSLSALGDVISALSAELPHVPYRNSKLTQVMCDSLGGNAKTLMIVNVSPSGCNLDETLTSLCYATRVKNITNNAQRNVESKEIAHLKEMIMKLKSGQTLEDGEDV